MAAKSSKSGLNLKEKRGERFYKGFIVALSSFLLAFLAASVLSPVNQSDAQEVTISNNVTGYYVTVRNSDNVNLSVNSTATGAYASAKDTINVKTNVPTGYKLYISSSSEDMYNSEDTTHTGVHLTGVSGTLASPKELSQNTWGFTKTAIDIPVPSSSATFAAVPDDGTELIEETNSANESTGVDTDVYFGVRANSYLTTGDYTTTIYYTAIAEGATEPFMQEFTSAECSAMSTDSTTRLMDVRNTEIYTIVKAKDGNCWMADNLQIDDVTIYPTDSNIHSGSFYIPESSNWSGNITDQAKLHIATNSGYEGEHYYNWFTATAGSTESTAGATVDQSICPKGWRLPINGDANQDKSWAKLMNAYGVTTGANLVNPSHSSYILGFTRYYGGWSYDQAVESVQGQYGFFWSSTPASGTNAYDLTYYTSGIRPQDSSYVKGNGYTLRCVFEGETIQDITYMQDMTKGICDATQVGVTTRLRDIRGRGNAGSAEDDSYGVIKAKDGNCWMTENFDLYNTASSSVQLTSDNTDIPAGSDGSVSTYTLPASSNWTSNIYTEPKVHQATNSGYTDVVYYNWTAAVAMQNGSTATKQDQSICPKNWTLSNGGNASVNKSFAKLMGAYGVTTGPNLVNPSHESYILGFRYYGYWNLGHEDLQGTSGGVWSSTPVSESKAYRLAYYSTGISFQYTYEKGYGWGVRCVSRD